MDNKIITHSLLFLCLILSQNSQAFTWQDLWARRDEQGTKLMAKSQYKQAANRFKNQQWQGVAHYRARNFKQSLDAFSNSHSNNDVYNKGNALARLGRFEEAIASYESVLEKDPRDADAKYNRDLLKKLMKQNKKQQKPKSGSSNNKNNQTQSGQSNQSKKQPKPNQQKQNGKNKKMAEKQKSSTSKQWLRQIPDNPGGLLRQKFLRDHMKLWKKNRG